MVLFCCGKNVDFLHQESLRKDWNNGVKGRKDFSRNDRST